MSEMGDRQQVLCKWSESRKENDIAVKKAKPWVSSLLCFLHDMCQITQV